MALYVRLQLACLRQQHQFFLHYSPESCHPSVAGTFSLSYGALSSCNVVFFRMRIFFSFLVQYRPATSYPTEKALSLSLLYCRSVIAYPEEGTCFFLSSSALLRSAGPGHAWPKASSPKRASHRSKIGSPGATRQGRHCKLVCRSSRHYYLYSKVVQRSFMRQGTILF